jgi:phosphoribosylcarboxyaminoimidazole (NCAIR) mutase
MNQKPINLDLEVVPAMKMPAKIPKLKDGKDAEAAERLGKMFDDAQTGMRRIIALGMFAWELKQGQLKHGEFGAWLAAHKPELATAHSKTGAPMASRALQGHMVITRDVLAEAGFPTIKAYLGGFAKSASNADLDGGRFLLIEDKKVPQELKPLRDKICAMVDGKTAKQLNLQYSRSDEDEDEEVAKPKRGALPGSKGLTKEMREKAALKKEQERINELEVEIIEETGWLDEITDAKNLGMMPDKVLRKFAERAQAAAAFATATLEARKAGGAK